MASDAWQRIHRKNPRTLSARELEKEKEWCLEKIKEWEERKAVYQAKLDTWSPTNTHGGWTRELLEWEVEIYVSLVQCHHQHFTACQTRLDKFKDGDQESTDHFLEDALKYGKVAVTIITCIILGCAGAGKTCFKHVILGWGKPYERSSTSCTDKVARVELKKFLLNMKCESIDPNNLREIIAVAVNSIRKKPKTNRQVSTSQSISEPSSEDQFVTASEVQSENDMLSDDVIIDAISKVKSEVNKLMTKLKSKEDSDTLKMEWLYLTDSGGQPPFIEVLPFFINSLSCAVYVFRLCDEVEKPTPVQYYIKNKEICIGKHSVNASALDTLKYLIQMIKSRPEDTKFPPKLFIVGTHEDCISDCENETLDDKNTKIFKLLRECEAQDMVSFVSSGDAIYAVDNHRDISDFEQKGSTIEIVKEKIANLPTKKIDFPIYWYVFELLLQEMAQSLERSVLSFNDCQKIALHLDFKDGELARCLTFLNNHNVIHYTPILDHVVFVDPQVPVDKVSELVRFSYFLQDLKNRESLFKLLYPESKIDVFDLKWEKLKNQGILTRASLEEFTSHYVDGVFSCADLCKLFESLLIMVRLSSNVHDDALPGPNTKYFMPCLLKHLCDTCLSENRCLDSVIAEPILVCFHENLPRPGIFCSVVAHLIKSSNWKITFEDECFEEPVMVKRNCITFAVETKSVNCHVTLINSIACIEVHVKFYGGLPMSEYGLVLPDILSVVKNSVDESSHALRYETKLTYGFFCSCNYFSRSNNSDHIGKVSLNKENLNCGSGSEGHSTKLKPRQSVWFTGNTSSQEQAMYSLDRRSHAAGAVIGIVVAIIAVFLALLWYGIGNNNTESRSVQNFSDKGVCTAIESSKALEKELRKINTDFVRMCDYLEIENCNFLKNSGNLNPFTIAQGYINKQVPKACWEDIVKHVCVDFANKRLASEIAEKHNVLFFNYCSL